MSLEQVGQVVAASEPVSPPPSRPRLMSLDALRGFDMFLIIGGGGIVGRLNQMVNPTDHVRAPWLQVVDQQLHHKDWAGFAFLDLIFPLFVFMVGVSIVYSLSKQLSEHGRGGAYGRIVRRFLLLFAMGVIAAGGIANRWPNVQLCGVLHRIAWCYLFGSLIFCHLRPRAIAGLTAGLLVGYWALLTFVPFPNVQLPDSISHPPGPNEKFPDLSEKFNSVEKITGKYDKGLNLCNYFDARYMPGRKYCGYYSPEGILSTIAAVASCLLGVLAGCLIRSPRSDRFKILWLLVGGIAGVLLGFLWGQQFPVIKKIWTSSFVLVAGGYSAILLAVFYLVIDVWKWRFWCLPFVWIGTNALTAYMVRNLFRLDEVAPRLTGGDLSYALNRWVYPGTGSLLTTTVGLLLIWWLTWFLYRNKVFIRL